MFSNKEKGQIYFSLFEMKFLSNKV